LAIKVFDLEFDDECYFIKRPSIVQTIEFDNRTFYAKFECVKESLTKLVIQQHQNRDFTIATPLIQNNQVRYMLIEYDGDEAIKFSYLIKSILSQLGYKKFYIYQGKNEYKIQVFIKVNNLSLSQSSKKLESISNLLLEKLNKKWKLLPSQNLPYEYNIATLPYKELTF